MPNGQSSQLWVPVQTSTSLWNPYISPKVEESSDIMIKPKKNLDENYF